MTTTSSTTDTGLDARTSSFAAAYAITAIFNAIVVWLKEAIPAVHDGMAAILGHHWIAHGVLDLIVFFALGFYLTSRGYRTSGSTAANFLIWGTILGGIMVVGFFVIVG